MDDCFLKKKQYKRQFLNVKTIDSCGKEPLMHHGCNILILLNLRIRDFSFECTIFACLNKQLVVYVLCYIRVSPLPVGN